MKTISEKLREHALSPQGMSHFFYIKDPDVYRAAYGWLTSDEYPHLHNDEVNGMFCLFVAEALEA